jgi:hypothetical protein
MTELGRAKGLDLTWFAVKHENTEHAHAHVIVLPRDLNGRRVRFYKTDYTKIKELGDSYLIRNRLLSRDREYEKEDKGKPAVTDFFNRLKTAIKTAFKLIRHRIIADADDGEPVAQPPRNTSRDEELLGPAPAYWQLEALRTLGDAKRKERAWRRYTKPIIVDYSDGLSGLKIATYTPKTNLLSLRRLERKFMAGDKTVTNQLSDDDFNRLRGWIREQYREDKSLERQAKAIKSIKVELSAEEDLEVSSRSSIESLKRLKKKHLKGEVNLNDAEYKALSDWLIDRQRTGET